MISFLEGELVEKGVGRLVLNVAGVGYELIVPTSLLAALPAAGEQVRVHTRLVVREDSMTLFGFADEDEKQVFELVQTASGVGPKLAQAMLAVLTPDAVRRAVAGDDVRTLTSVPGIGQKGAQRIILELKDRLGAPVSSAGGRPVANGEPWRDQVQQGLVGLGWSAKDADRAAEAVSDQAGDEPDVPALLRAALRTLSKA
jgi:holliday junction DNA helicase RuvA